ncbi:hypothetical protein AB0L57_06715 [Nocardia sp. NPDC052254]|uniref:hypothetical protein n=1 Tax=Nocardia sp. NPDC052254 TaxID=3155681 RepID=UPI0034195876
MRHRDRPAIGSPGGIRRPGTGAVRGGLVGVAVAVLAVAAHGWAGGGHPGSAALTLLLLIATATGISASMLPPARWGRAAGLAALGGGQGVAHLALSVLPAHDTGETSCGGDVLAVQNGWMAAAHAIATIVCALLIVAAERLYAAVSRSVRAITTRPRALPILATTRWRPDPRQPWQRLNGRAVSSRAPPVFA